MKTPIKKSIKLQTEKPRTILDLIKEDWVESLVFRRAARQEAFNRGIAYEDNFDDQYLDEDIEVEQSIFGMSQSHS